MPIWISIIFKSDSRRDIYSRNYSLGSIIKSIKFMILNLLLSSTFSIVLIYPIKILFHVFYISDLERLSIGILVLALLPKI